MTKPKSPVIKLTGVHIWEVSKPCHERSDHKHRRTLKHHLLIIIQSLQFFPSSSSSSSSIFLHLLYSTCVVSASHILSGSHLDGYIFSPPEIIHKFIPRVKTPVKVKDFKWIEHNFPIIHVKSKYKDTCMPHYQCHTTFLSLMFTHIISQRSYTKENKALQNNIQCLSLATKYRWSSAILAPMKKYKH